MDVEYRRLLTLRADEGLIQCDLVSSRSKFFLGVRRKPDSYTDGAARMAVISAIKSGILRVAETVKQQIERS